MPIGKPVKKIQFEPKIPEKKEIKKEVIKTEEKIENKEEDKTELKGMFAPISFTALKEFQLEKQSNGFIINNLPNNFQNELTFVQFNDGSFGIRKGNEIYELDSSFLGDGFCVEIEEKAKGIGNVEFMMNFIG